MPPGDKFLFPKRSTASSSLTACEAVEEVGAGLRRKPGLRGERVIGRDDGCAFEASASLAWTGFAETAQLNGVVSLRWIALASHWLDTQPNTGYPGRCLGVRERLMGDA